LQGSCQPRRDHRVPESAGFGEALINCDLDYQVVKQTTEWNTPARFDQVLEVSVRGARLGNTTCAPASTRTRENI